MQGKLHVYSYANYVYYDFTQQCNEEGYAGNDALCARDSDRDNFPDVELNCSEPTCSVVRRL